MDEAITQDFDVSVSNEYFLYVMIQTLDSKVYILLTYLPNVPIISSLCRYT